MVTEYADGPSLSEYISSYGALGPEMLYGLATGLAEALTVIHAAGIVHRDLKPSNVILTDAWPEGDRLRHRSCAGRDVRDEDGDDGRLGGFHGAGADQRASGPGGGHLRLGCDGRLRGDRAAAVRCRGDRRRVVPGHVRRPGYHRDARPAAAAGGSGPGQGPAGPADRAGAAWPAGQRLAAITWRCRFADPGHPGADLAADGAPPGRPRQDRENRKDASVLLGPVPAGAAAPSAPAGPGEEGLAGPSRQGNRRVGCGDRGRCHRRDRRDAGGSSPEDRGAHGERGKPQSAEPHCPGYPAHVSWAGMRAASSRRSPASSPRGTRW